MRILGSRSESVTSASRRSFSRQESARPGRKEESVPQPPVWGSSPTRRSLSATPARCKADRVGLERAPLSARSAALPGCRAGQPRQSVLKAITELRPGPGPEMDETLRYRAAAGRLGRRRRTPRLRSRRSGSPTAADVRTLPGMQARAVRTRLGTARSGRRDAFPSRVRAGADSSLARYASWWASRPRAASPRLVFVFDAGAPQDPRSSTHPCTRPPAAPPPARPGKSRPAGPRASPDNPAREPAPPRRGAQAAVTAAGARAGRSPSARESSTREQDVAGPAARAPTPSRNGQPRRAAHRPALR